MQQHALAAHRDLFRDLFRAGSWSCHDDCRRGRGLDRCCRCRGLDCASHAPFRALCPACLRCDAVARPPPRQPRCQWPPPRQLSQPPPPPLVPLAARRQQSLPSIGSRAWSIQDIPTRWLHRCRPGCRVSGRRPCDAPAPPPPPRGCRETTAIRPRPPALGSARAPARRSHRPVAFRCFASVCPGATGAFRVPDGAAAAASRRDRRQAPPRSLP